MSLVRIITRVAAATVACGTTAALAGGVPAARAEPARDPAGPDPVLQTIALVPAAEAAPTGRSLAAPGAARAGAAAAAAMTVSRRGTRPFSMLGATWHDAHAALGGTVQVRTRSAADGAWTRWQALDAAEPDAADTRTEGGPTRGATDPLWVGASDGVEARVAPAGGRPGPLPADLRLDLINPDEDMGAATESAPTARFAAAPPTPRLITRAGWRANESIVQHPPEYTSDVQVLFVHHTATGNTYTCNQSAAIIRGIEAYHVRSKGWNDIGYNFLVDKCGNLFEGRKGGVDRAVLGAHTLGFNSHSAAIAVLGNYDAVPAPAVVRNVIAQVAAYKVGMYGHNPAGSAVLVSNGSDRYPKGRAVPLHRISGHRDTGRTACPGDALYAQLGSIRAVAGAAPAGLGFLRMAGAVKVGSRFITRGAVAPVWSLRTPSAMLNRFDLYVDGSLAGSVANTSRTRTLSLSPGSHTVTVRAVHLNGTTAGTTVSVLADATAPMFARAPTVQLRPGSMGDAVPVRLLYTVGDAGGLRSVALTRPAAVNLGIATRSYPMFAAPGTATTWTVRAADWAGNARNASVTGTPVIASEAQAARTGSWRTRTGSGFLGGRALLSSTAGSTMTWSFTGSAASLAVARTTGSGRVRVYLDGTDYGAIDLRAGRTLYRYAVFAPHWGGSGTHTLKVRVEGTSGRPGVIIDGLTHLA